MKIVICGSMTASSEMLEVEKELVSYGHECVLPDFVRDYAKLGDMGKMHKESVKNKIKHDLIRGYFDKISKGDAILVLNIERKRIAGYIGGNTFLEMGFSHVLSKKIFLLNKIPNVSFSDEIVAMKPIVLDGDLKKIQLDKRDREKTKRKPPQSAKA